MSLHRLIGAVQVSSTLMAATRASGSDGVLIAQISCQCGARLEGVGAGPTSEAAMANLLKAAHEHERHPGWITAYRVGP